MKVSTTAADRSVKFTMIQLGRGREKTDDRFRLDFGDVTGLGLVREVNLGVVE